MPFNKPDIRQLSAVGSTVGDVYFPQTKLLLPFDGSNGATTTSDLSDANRTVTFYGTAQLSTAESKFGGSSMLFDGDSDYLTVPHVSSDIVTELTLETWFKTSSSAYSTLIGTFSSSAGSHIQINTELDGGFAGGAGTGYVGVGVHGNSQVDSSSGGYSDGNWHHVALTRNASNLVTVWVDGVSKGTMTDSSAMPAHSFYIGRLNHSSARYFDGYLDDVRWTPSVCRYTSNFTPPTTAHLTSAGDVNKQILINSTADGVAIGTGGINQARIAKVWCSFNGEGTIAFNDSYNCSSLTDNGAGDYTVNFSTDLSNDDYSAIVSGREHDDSNISGTQVCFTKSTLANTFGVGFCRIGNVWPHSGDFYDAVRVNLIVFGN